MRAQHQDPEIRNSQRERAELPLFREYVGNARKTDIGELKRELRQEQARARRNDPPNSKLAAASVINLGRTRDAILDILGSFGDMTDEQIAQWYGDRWKKWNYPKSSPSGLRSRRAELVKLNFVKAVGTGKTKSGRPCAIWGLNGEKK